jgi:hypothetical protein
MKRRKTVDTKFIMSLNPCDIWPESRVWRAVPKRIPLTEFLRAEHIPAVDRLWVVLRREFLGDRLLRLFACDCAERSLIREREAGREPDERSWNAVAVARRYANGEVTDEELEAAWYAAWSAAWSAAWTAGAASRSAWEAAWSAAWAAEGPARASALNASWASAWVDRVHERIWQAKHLAEMIEKGE